MPKWLHFFKMERFRWRSNQTLRFLKYNSLEPKLTYLLVSFHPWKRKVLNCQAAIALLQISFPNGKCYLIHFTQSLPGKLLDVFEDPKVLKLGVGILDEDLKRFQLQWNIQPQGLVDVRHLVLKYHPKVHKLGVAHLATTFLNLSLDKYWRIRASNWEDQDLTDRQVAYAANDVLAVMAIVLKIVFDNNQHIHHVESLVLACYSICFSLQRSKF